MTLKQRVSEDLFYEIGGGKERGEIELPESTEATNFWSQNLVSGR